MRVPYFRAKDKDSEQYVEGFYVEFPEHFDTSRECKLVHVIMVVVPDTNSSIPNMPMLGMFGGGEELQNALNETFRKNTLNFCTIDITTLQQIGEVEIGANLFKPDGYIKSPNSQIVLT